MGKNKKKLKLNRRRIIVLIVLALIILAILFGMSKIFSNILSQEKIVGNYSNMGLAVEDGKVIYYNKYEKGIIKVEGDKETKLTDQTAYSMTIIDDTIYYLTVSSDNTIDLNSVSKSGENLKKIKTLYTSISKFYINDGYVYYVSDQGTSGLSKLSIENPSEEKTIIQANIQDFVLENNKIYYTDNIGYLYSIKLDGTDKKEISTEYKIRKIQILNNWIYFYDEQENALCKIKKNGSPKKTVATFVNNETYNVTSKGIYYFDLANKQICKSDLKGKKSHVITPITATTTRINIVNGVIYYLDNSKDLAQIHQMYRIKENGKEVNPIEY